jgi:hypothetical protein
MVGALLLSCTHLQYMIHYSTLHYITFCNMILQKHTVSRILFLKRLVVMSHHHEWWFHINKLWMLYLLFIISVMFLLTAKTETILNETASCHWAWGSVTTQFDIYTHIFLSPLCLTRGLFCLNFCVMSKK